MPSAAAIYVRISQDRTGQGLGVGRQEVDCRGWAERHGWTVAELYADDDLSAYSGKARPGYRRLLSDISAGSRDGLVVWHPDRLHRSPVELEDFIALVERTGLQIGTVTAGDIDLASATGRMTARIVGAVARHESEHKAERIRRKALELAELGAVPGGGIRPFGYEADRVTIREDEARLIREAAERVLAGDGVRTVAADWNRRGVRSVTGADWRPTTIKRLLRSGRIAGWREHHGQLVAQATWPAIIDPADGRQLRKLLDDPARDRTGGATARSYLLSGFVRCGACGSALTARPVRRKGHRYRRYACVTDRGGCNRVGIIADPLENLVVEAVMLRLDSPALAKVVRRRKVAISADSTVEDIEGRLGELAEMFAAGEISRAEWSTARKGLTGRLEKARTVDAAQVKSALVDEQLAKPGVLREQWPTLGLDRRRLVLGALVDAITIAPTTKGGNRFDPLRVDITWRV